MRGELIFYNSRKDLAFINSCQWIDHLEPAWGPEDPKRRYDAKRNFTLAVIVIEGGEKPCFPVRSDSSHGGYDAVSVTKNGDEWVIEVGWINFWHMSNADAIGVLESRVKSVAGDRHYRGVVGTYDRFTHLPDYARNRMDIAIGMTEWGMLAEYAGRREDSDVKRNPVVDRRS